MLAKTFCGGRTYNGAKATIKYLLNKRVSEGTAKVLEGNSELTLAYIKQADKNAWSWSSGVLTFEETLTAEQKEDVISEFKKMMFPGMKEEQFNLLIVEHTDKNRTELHYIIPRIELQTGKAFNPYYVKKDLIKKDLFQDFINLKHGFSSHKDNPQVVPKKPTWTKKAKVADIRKAIDNALLPLIKNNIIQNRSELIYQLSEWGYELNRTGKDSISITDQNGKNTKLKGLIYGQGFENGLSGVAEKIRNGKKLTITGAERNISTVREELERNIKYQAEYNRKRYKSTAGAGGEDKKRSKYINKGTQNKESRGSKYGEEQNNTNISITEQKHDSIRTTAIKRIRKIRTATSSRNAIITGRINSYKTTKLTDPHSIAKRRQRTRFRRATQRGIVAVVSGLGEAFGYNYNRRISEVIRHVKKLQKEKSKEQRALEREIAQIAHAVQTVPAEKTEQEQEQEQIHSLLGEEIEEEFSPGIKPAL